MAALRRIFCREAKDPSLGKEKELGNPPGKVVWWTLRRQDGEYLHAQGKTAFEAASKVGLMLSQCDSITWQDEKPWAVGIDHAKGR